MDLGRMLIIFSTNLPRIMKRRQETKMKSIGWEMLLLSRRESAKIMMPSLKLLIMIFTKLLREHKNLLNSLMLRILSKEHWHRILMPLKLSLLEHKMIIPDLLLKFKLSKGILTDNSHKKVTSKDKLKMRMLEIEICKPNCSTERPNWEQLMTN